MNWRRGLLLAAIHLSIATATFVREDIRFWPSMSAGEPHVGQPQMRLAAFQEQQVPSTACDEGIYDVGPSALVNVVAMANLPVAIATGWHYPCMPRSQRSRITVLMESSFGGNTRRATVAAEAFQCSTILVLWILIGGFPLIRPRRRWLEPSVLITGCTILGSAIAASRYFEFYKIFMLALAVLWLWYFLLLLWKPVHLAWQSTLPRLRRLS